MVGQEDAEVSPRTLILALIAAAMVSLVGLTIYFIFKDSNPTIAVYGAILVFAGLMPLTVFPRLLLRRKLRKPSSNSLSDSTCVASYIW